LGLAISKQLPKPWAEKLVSKARRKRIDILVYRKSQSPDACSAVTSSCAGSTVIVVHPSVRIGQILCDQLRVSGLNAISTTTAQQQLS